MRRLSESLERAEDDNRHLRCFAQKKKRHFLPLEKPLGKTCKMLWVCGLVWSGGFQGGGDFSGLETKMGATLEFEATI